MKLTPEDRAMMSPEEISALEGPGADEALATMAGETPEAAAQDPASSDDEPNAAEEAAEQPASHGAAEEQQVEQEAQASAASEQPLVLTVEQRDFAAEKTALRAKRRDVEAKWSSGELSDEERAAKLDELEDKIETLVVAQTRANTLAEINAQQAADRAAREDNAEQEATALLIKAAKAAKTIDYLTDTVAQSQFDMALDMLKADPGNKAKLIDTLVQDAHKAVLALRGIGQARTEQPAATAQQQQAAQRRNVPQTLAGIPAAAPVGMQDELMDQMSRLEGDDLERFISGLTPTQQSRLMNNIDRMALGIN